MSPTASPEEFCNWQSGKFMCLACNGAIGWEFEIAYENPEGDTDRNFLIDSTDVHGKERCDEFAEVVARDWFCPNCHHKIVVTWRLKALDPVPQEKKKSLPGTTPKGTYYYCAAQTSTMSTGNDNAPNKILFQGEEPPQETNSTKGAYEQMQALEDGDDDTSTTSNKKRGYRFVKRQNDLEGQFGHWEKIPSNSFLHRRKKNKKAAAVDNSRLVSEPKCGDTANDSTSSGNGKFCLAKRVGSVKAQLGGKTSAGVRRVPKRVSCDGQALKPPPKRYAYGKTTSKGDVKPAASTHVISSYRTGRGGEVNSNPDRAVGANLDRSVVASKDDDDGTKCVEGDFVRKLFNGEGESQELNVTSINDKEQTDSDEGTPIDLDTLPASTGDESGGAAHYKRERKKDPSRLNQYSDDSVD
jgi:hypothetical protein